VPTAEELAPHFPQLEILEPLGRGGLGVVYKARQRELDRTVALKVLTVDPQQDPTFAERFAREARALASLAHPHTVAIHDSGRAGEHYDLLMEYVDGLDLRRLIEGEELRSRAALELVSQISGALQYAHDEGVVHRDIKPENILVDRKGHAKIADFGLAKLLSQQPADPALTGTHQAMGTWHYWRPSRSSGRSRSTTAPTSTRWAWSSTSCSPARCRSRDSPRPPARSGSTCGSTRSCCARSSKEAARRYHAGDVKTRVDQISESTPKRPSRRRGRARIRRPNTPAASAVTGLAALGLAIVGLVVLAVLAVHRSRLVWTVADPPAYAGAAGVLLLGAGALLFLGLFALGVTVLARHARAAWPWLVAGALTLSGLTATAFYAVLRARLGTMHVSRGFPVGLDPYPAVYPVGLGANVLPWLLLGGGLLLMGALTVGLILTLRPQRAA
jgi:predicted Ser/Thr protein kinase